MLNEYTLRIVVMMLLRDEGIKLKAYRCPAGKWTIGAGRNFEDNPLSADEQLQLFGVVYGSWHQLLGHLCDEGLSQAQCEWLLLRDIRATHKQMLKIGQLARIHASCSPERWAAFINMAYQMGIGGVLAFRKTLSHAAKGKWSRTAAEAMDSSWAEQTPDRAGRIHDVLCTGTLESYS